MGRMVEGQTLLYAACFALAVLAACTDPGNRGSSARARTAGPAGAAVTAGSFDFPKGALGTRELVDQALIKRPDAACSRICGIGAGFHEPRRRARALIPGGQGRGER